MRLEVITPGEFLGEVLGDLGRRRANIKNIEGQGDIQVVRANLPLSESFGYANALRSLSQGRASYTMEFESYEEAPESVVNAQRAANATREEQMVSSQKIRIILKAFDHKILDQSAGQIVEAAERTGARVTGPVPLPTSIKRFCVIRGPHIDKDSREHFELRTHNRLIDIVEPTTKTIDSLTRLTVPAGVDIAIKL